MIRRGDVKGRQVCKGAPWVIKAEDVAGKLFAFFVYPSPEPEAVEPFAEVFRRTGGSIKAVVRAILTSDVFYSPRAYRARLKPSLKTPAASRKATGTPG